MNLRFATSQHLLDIANPKSADDARRRLITSIILLGMGSMTLLGGLIIGVFALEDLVTPEDAKRLLGSLAVSLFVFSALYFVNRFVSGTFAASAFVLTLLGAIFLVDAPREIVSGRSTFLLVLPILIASVTLRPWASFVVATLNGLMVSYLDIAVLGYAVPSIPTILGFLTVALIAWLSSRSLENAVKDLRTINRELDQRVEDRTRELREANEQLKQSREREAAANRAKSVFLANMSHELRTPLNAILGFAQLLERDPGLGGEQREDVRTITRSGTHLLELINEVLELSRIEAGRTVLQESNFELAALLDELSSLFSLRAQEKGLQLIIDAPDKPRYIRADERKLRQVLVNLVSNAIKFTSEGGVAVRVAWKADEGRLHFEVQDTGVGIAESDLDTLFDPFVQTEAGQRAEEGTGLGLPISQRFVALMGGSLNVSSKVGIGSIFRFDIPASIVLEIPGTTEDKKRRVVGLAPGQQQYRILVVEDLKENRRLLTKLLQRLGFEVREAINGQEGIAVWEEWDPHLIWMDMRMPVMNGYEATRHIKATARGQAVTVVALTATAFEESKREVLDAGCDDFVRKPFATQEIYSVLAKHLGIQFIYDTEDEETAPEQESEIEAEGIPASVREALCQAAQYADYTRCSQILDDNGLNGPLRRLLASYQFDVIIRLMEE